MGGCGEEKKGCMGRGMWEGEEGLITIEAGRKGEMNDGIRGRRMA